MEAVILIGIQGSGKSTFYRERFFDTHVRISLDLLKTRHREREFLRLCLATGQRFVVDNTNTRAAERAVYIAAARNAGFHIAGYFFDAPVREAMARNLKRAGAGKIPPAAVMGTWKRLEKPRLDENFHEIFLVSSSQQDHFLVSHWTGAREIPNA
jgi:predicted kinase